VASDRLRAAFDELRDATLAALGRPATPGDDEPPPPKPAGGVDLSQWKLTIPETKDGKVVEIRPPALATYSSRYFENLGNGLGYRFRCWHGGDTTQNSKNPRSELRERYNNDPEGYWTAGKGRHTMEFTGQVNRLTKVKPHLVIGQVHDDEDDVCVWRVEADKLWLTKGDDPHGFLVDGNFQLGKPYTCRYEIRDGVYAFLYNGTRLDYTLKSTAKSYFKVGDYLQSNPKTAPSESTDEYAEVILRSVTVTHG
jgi:alginate lyase